MVSVLSDVTNRIQRGRRGKPKGIHTDHIEPYLGPALKSWIVEGEGTVMPAECQVVRAGEVEPVSGSVAMLVATSCTGGGHVGWQ